MCNPSEISLFSNDLSRKQLWPEANVATRKKEGKKKKGKFKSQVGLARLVTEKAIFSFVNKERIIWKSLGTQ